MNVNSICEIMATTGPTMEDVETIAKAITAGVANFRLHLGLRTRDTCQYFYNIREAEKIAGQTVEVLLDLPSSRPRIGVMDEIELFPGKEIYIYDSNVNINNFAGYEAAPLPDLQDLTQNLQVGHRIMFRDGTISFTILSIEQSAVKVKCNYANKPFRTLSSSCFPDSDVLYKPVVEEDIQIMQKMKARGLTPDWVALSFATSKEQIKQVKEAIRSIWDTPIRVMAKIETQKGIDNIEEILENCDGLMVGRGDLAQNIEPYKLPEYQEYLVKKAKELNKVAVVATEIMEFMAETGNINRAELSDMALIARQRANAAMLARETGNSKYAFECLELIKNVFKNEMARFTD